MIKMTAMKKAIKIVLLTVFFITLTVALNSVMGQPMPGGDPSGGGINPPVGGYAPIGSGLIILLSLGAGYGSKKLYNARKKLVE
jgi:hypothetical protein